MPNPLDAALVGAGLSGLALLASLTASAGTIKGRVFEDVNYGGGRGAAYATTGGLPRGGARVERYDTGSKQFLDATTTGSDGSYSFAFNTVNNNFTIRVVSSSVTSSRRSGTNSVPVVTYRTIFTGKTPSTKGDDFAYVGGQNPGVADGGANETNLTLSAAGAQVYVNISDADRFEDFVNVDFGFSFNVVTNTSDAGQGSLRQFIVNANALNNSAISQRRFDNNGMPAGPGFPAGQETAIFMIPDGTARPGLRAGLTSQLTTAGGAAVTNNANTTLPYYFRELIVSNLSNNPV
ncbi:hypothetical protein QMK33_23375 [Hymenobacter sp. H14-R3]|uniref:hypothetical protein n=1 Tax=Hymenobacter sp. H14-R3 TaxID=3046308 RepID=UPI0024BADAD5|nr:hypothetical protein [Hymenobacter sp. H14-R3]MDJ0368093.1 hypothetical protein [Hymenobacter sp. H14-R3]